MALWCPNFPGRFYCKPWRIWIILLHLTKAFNWNFIHARPRQKNERKKGGNFQGQCKLSANFFLEDLQKSHLTFDNFDKIDVLVNFSIPKVLQICSGFYCVPFLREREKISSTFFGPTYVTYFCWKLKVSWHFETEHTMQSRFSDTFGLSGKCH